MRVEYAGVTDVGCKRTKNEDSLITDEKLNLFMVADGMGGHSAGEFASRMAVQTVLEIIQELTDDPDATLQNTTSIRPGDFKAYLRYAITQASQKIYEKATEDSSMQGMGTTAVVCLFRKNRVFIANVGDSRGYRIRNKKIEQVTEDHSLVAEQIRAGILRPSEAKEHRLKNIITRSVGFQEIVDVDCEAKSAKVGDIYLLCSDGLYNMMEDDEILGVVSQQPLQDAAAHLIDIAKTRGGDDNITLVLAKIGALDDGDPDEDEESTLQS